MQPDNLLLSDLISGFISSEHASYGEFRPRMLVNDIQRQEKVLTSVIGALSQCSSFIFSVAFVTKSGVAVLMNTLEELRSKGVRGRILVSQYQNFSEPEALRSLLKFDNIELRIVTQGNFHAKGYLFENQNKYCTIIIGSSNLTANALCYNKEWNISLSATTESHITKEIYTLFNKEFEGARTVNEAFICQYEKIYSDCQKNILLQKQMINSLPEAALTAIHPNLMQSRALESLSQLRKDGAHRALLISATGTGKTFLSAFDAQQVGARRLLFIVHRENIARNALESFSKVFGATRTYGLYNGNIKEADADFIFASNLTLARSGSLEEFATDHFDYIIMDESHHLGAATYQRIINHFRPGFLLGMTATPERSDGFDVFGLFNHNIAGEIRLQQAMNEDMLAPFHYFGISDIEIEGKSLTEKSDFRYLVSQQRINHIAERIRFYSTDTGRIKGIVFCSNVRECESLSLAFCGKGLRSRALYGMHSEQQREQVISMLENGELDLIFTVDIFNEGIDIPTVNLIVMLRPTQSAIIFVQQLGRGLRKSPQKKYLTVLDFIGNYENNYMIPVALFGNRDLNKEELRRLMIAGSSLIPGTSTINFDQIAREKIFHSIDTARTDDMRPLKEEYMLMKYRLGRIPMMCDFLEFGSRDPFQYVEKRGSMRNFIAETETGYCDNLDSRSAEILALLSSEVCNGMRILESQIMKKLILEKDVSTDELLNGSGNQVTTENLHSAILNLNLNYITRRVDSKEQSIGGLMNADIVRISGKTISRGKDLQHLLESDSQYHYLRDLVDYDLILFNRNNDPEAWRGGFRLYGRYGRKDVFRILNWRIKPNEQNVGGYKMSEDRRSCALFVTINKQQDTPATRNFDNILYDRQSLRWFSRTKRYITSPDVAQLIRFRENNMRILLFIRKSTDEGKRFYYMGDVEPQGWKQSQMPDAKGTMLPVVECTLHLKEAIEERIFSYLKG